MRFRCTLATCVILSSVLTQAMFMQPDIENVPVERLSKNVEAKLEKDPDNPELLFRLARIHSMAYAKKSASLEITKPKGEEQLWLGHVPKGIPYTVVTTEDKAAQAAADKHLKKAIELHKKAVAAKADHFLARLGLAWCTEQSGDKQAAISLYRELIKDALPSDRKINGRYHGLPTISTEASTYLIKLLDRETDAEEIARLKEQSAETEKRIPRYITPVAVALKDNLSPEAFIDTDTAVSFDLDGSGMKRDWQWIHPDAAWLVYDPTASGTITSGLQLFGNVTFWLFWENGYAAISALDDNADGVLRDRELVHLALWQDRNRNGVSEAGEVKPVADHDIIQIDCSWVVSDSGMPYNPEGVTLKNGLVRTTCDVILEAAE